MSSITKKCSKCGLVKPTTEFQKNKGWKDGLHYWCKECANRYTREKRLKNPERFREYDRKKWENDQEKIKERNRRWRIENSDKLRESKREYRINNIEKVKERDRQWRIANSEKISANGKVWYLANLEEVRKRARAWTKNNPIKRMLHNQTRRALKKSNGGKITEQEWQALKKFYRYTCLRCKRKEPEIKLTIDHVLPLKLGGSNAISNAQPLCVSCNSSKKSKYIDYR